MSFGKRAAGGPPSAPAQKKVSDKPAAATPQSQPKAAAKPAEAAKPAPAPAQVKPPPAHVPEPKMSPDQSAAYYETKTTIFNALIDTIDLGQLAQLDQESAREEIRDIVVEIISIKNVVMSITEQETLLDLSLIHI